MNDSPVILEMCNMPVVALRDTSQVVLQNVNWSVRQGEFWVVAGPQHSGKSDLLLHAAGLITPAEGVCRVFGCDTRTWNESQLRERLRVGLTFAEGKLFYHLTIAENVALPLKYHRGLEAGEVARQVAALLEWLELTPWAGLTPVNVPSAWRQRAALARALALQPELLLLDNPNGGLTLRHRRWLVNFLDQLWRGHEFFGGRPLTIVAATDDLHIWEHPERRFAAVQQGTFSVLGAWDGEDFRRNHAVQELLSGVAEAGPAKT